MKTTIIISGLLLAVILTALNVHENPVTTEIDVLEDITDDHLAKPNEDEILKLYDFNGDNKWNGATFGFSTLSDVSYNRNEKLDIAPANKWLSNEPERDREIKKFKGDMTEIFKSITPDTIGKNYTSFYFPLAMQLQRLSESKADKRIQIVYSDLMQNNYDLTLYNKKEIQLMQSNPDSLKAVFEKLQPLPSLAGIEVYLIYQPKNTTDDHQYRVVSEFYKSLLEEKGAKVAIEANLSI